MSLVELRSLFHLHSHHPARTQQSLHRDGPSPDSALEVLRGWQDGAAADLLPRCCLGEQQGREGGMIERSGERRRKGEEKIIRKPPLPSAIVLFTRRLPTELRCRLAGKHVITENTVSKGIFQALTAHKLQFVDFFLGLDLN